ncbi:MAG: hypothetical protein ACREXY_20320, partial [Gammaproteobacteria bacterium]
MATTYADAPYCVGKSLLLRCAPRDRNVSRAQNRSLKTPRISRLPHITLVQLRLCNPPTGPLESAPRSALREDTANERWEGFWCVADERYYARCVRRDGSEQ